MWISNGGPLVYVSVPVGAHGYCEYLGTAKHDIGWYYVRPIGTRATWLVKPEWITL